VDLKGEDDVVCFGTKTLKRKELYRALRHIGYSAEDAHRLAEELTAVPAPKPAPKPKPAGRKPNSWVIGGVG
jgi:hypothetical protein